jgi:hypothetical protein
MLQFLVLASSLRFTGLWFAGLLAHWAVNRPPFGRSLTMRDLRTSGLMTRIPSAAKAGPAHSIRQIQPIRFS